jgi:hypothetical protein
LHVADVGVQASVGHEKAIQRAVLRVRVDSCLKLGDHALIFKNNNI